MIPSAHSPIPQDNQSDQAGGIFLSGSPPRVTRTSGAIEGLPPDWQYESAITVVETIIAQIEAGDLELADIFEQFGIAVQHLQDCEAFLRHHRQQVDILVETLTDELDE